MAIDMERVRAKLEKLRDPRKGKFEKKTWSIKEGETKSIRLVQYPHGEDPFLELWFHYNIDKFPLFCPKMNAGRSCPLCEFSDTLRGSTSEHDKEMSRALWAKQRFYAVVVDRSDASLTPKYWGFGKTVYDFLLDHLTKKDYQMYLDPVAGLDAELTCVKSPKGFPDTKVSFARRESPLADTQKRVSEIMAAIPPAEEVFKPLTTSELTASLQKWLKLDEDDGDEVVKQTETVAQSAEGATSDEDLKAAFDKALEGSAS